MIAAEQAALMLAKRIETAILNDVHLLDSPEFDGNISDLIINNAMEILAAYIKDTERAHNIGTLNAIERTARLGEDEADRLAAKIANQQRARAEDAEAEVASLKSQIVLLKLTAAGQEIDP